MNTDLLKDGNTSPFMFDVNFAAPDTADPIPMIALPDHETALKQAEEKGIQRGIAQGKAGEETRLANEARRIAVAAEKILAAIDLDRVRLERESAELSLSIANKLASSAISHFPLADIENLISECLGPLRKTPHLVVRLHEKDASSITETVGKFAREAGFEGRFVVLGEPDFVPGDCRIEWADGGIIRDRHKAEEDINAIFDNYFSPLIGPPERPTEMKDKTDQAAEGSKVNE